MSVAEKVGMWVVLTVDWLVDSKVVVKASSWVVAKAALSVDKMVAETAATMAATRVA